ncbi:hypothetical protein FSP39_016788 [Pinctada imbricata]|uniref:Uncharacterized protein n=1 Tax=Pinctada imbricata TaxID=66713 RepID=A0AA89C7W0_PINIB|nr:hypothetical protein FSP39_016788 [Pinctada imbricata]
MRLESVLIFVLALASFVSTDCPEQAHNEVTQCVNVLPNFKQPNESPTKIEMLKKSCRSGKVLDVGRCINNVVDKCQGTTDREQTLQRLIDSDNLIDTVNYFCGNLDVYEEHIDCINRQKQESMQCSKPEIQSMQRKFKAGANMDVMIMATCSLHTVTMDCMLNLISKNCNEAAAVFVERLFLGQRPPACQKVKTRYTSSGSSWGNGQTRTTPCQSIYVIVLLLAIYLYFLSIEE